MRLSLYTTLLPLTDDFSLIYSAMTDSFIVANNAAFTVRDGRIFPKNDNLARQLSEAKAVTDDNVDEVVELMKLINSTDNDNSVYYLHINPTLNCNFQCWYCYEEHKGASKMDTATLNAVIAHIRQVADTSPNLKYFQLSFFGGEPLFYFNEIADSIIRAASIICNEKNITFRVHFTTNGYLLDEEIRQSLANVNVSFQITLDGGPQAHDKVRFTSSGGSFDRIFKNTLFLARDGHHVLLRINYTSENILTVPQIIDQLAAVEDKAALANIKIDFQRVWQDRPVLTEDEIIDFVNSLREKLKLLGMKFSNSIDGLSHVSNSCYGDKTNHVLVNYDGNLFLCTARDFKPENSAGKLAFDGTLVWNTRRRQSFLSCKFNRSVCHRCPIAPICGGGCRQRLSETPDNGECIHSYTAEDLKAVVMKRFRARYNLV